MSAIKCSSWFVLRPYRPTDQVYENAMSEAKRIKMSKLKKNWGWLAHSPSSVALIFGIALTVVAGSAMYFVEYTRAPGTPSPFESKCNMWNRC